MQESSATPVSSTAEVATLGPLVSRTTSSAVSQHTNVDFVNNLVHVAAVFDVLLLPGVNFNNHE